MKAGNGARDRRDESAGVEANEAPHADADRGGSGDDGAGGESKLSKADRKWMTAWRKKICPESRSAMDTQTQQVILDYAVASGAVDHVVGSYIFDNGYVVIYRYVVMTDI